MQSVSEATHAGLAIGQRLEVGIQHGEDVAWFRSRIEDFDDTQIQLTLAWPTDADRRLISIEPGHTVRMVVATPDALFSVTATVDDVVKRGVPLITVRLNGGWQRSQRRNAVRLPVAIRPRVAARVMGDAYKDLRLGVTNISATGVQIRSQDELKIGDRLQLTFELIGLTGELVVQARVRRVRRQERVWDAGCEFEQISDRLASRIMQFIFAQQRAIARKGRV
jgi:c-di-GMP-binding flagellar brake protein YcgR